MELSQKPPPSTLQHFGLLEVEIDSDQMAKAPRVSKDGHSSLACDNNVQTSRRLRTQCICVTGVLRLEDVGADGQIVDLDLCHTIDNRVICVAPWGIHKKGHCPPWRL